MKFRYNILLIASCYIAIIYHNQNLTYNISPYDHILLPYLISYHI
jgi:hypothetical protein